MRNSHFARQFRLCAYFVKYTSAGLEEVTESNLTENAPNTKKQLHALEYIKLHSAEKL